MGTLIWTDTFDTYTAGSPIPAPWTAVSNTPISNAVKHGGANSVAVGAGGNNSGAIRALGSNVGPQFYIDFWFNSTAAVTSGASIVFYDTGASDLGIEFMPNFNSATSGLVRTSFLANFFSFTVAPGTWQHAVLEVTRALAGSVKLTIDGTVVGTHTFGMSAPIRIVTEHFGFTPERVAQAVRECIAHNRRHGVTD